MNISQPDSIPPLAGPLRISVALCTYNGARHLEEQLNSIALQQRQPDELVLCDDGSTDETISIAEKFAKQATFPVRIIRNPINLGYSRNFAKAISLCSGDIIALSDQDDLWYPHKLKRLAELFVANEHIGGIFSDGDLIDTASNKLEGTLWGSFSFLKADQDRLHAGYALEVLLQRNVVTGMAFAFRNCWKTSIDNMPSSWPHDAWIALMLARQNQLLPCPEHLVAYRVHENQSIGVPVTTRDKREYIQTHGFTAYFESSRRRNLDEYEKYARHFEDLIAVYAEQTDETDEQLLALARAKAQHARDAAQLLRLHRFRRWPDLFRNRKNYQLYSPTGIKAMLRDMFI